jgi:hypothetical protein
MTQPAETFDTYDAKGIREDLQDVIYSITPDDTPFYSACAKTKATNTLHEWQTDTLRDSADNAHIEGDDTAGNAVTATVRLNNYTQIFKNAVVVSDTTYGVKSAGRKEEMAYQMLKVAREQKLDIEKALFANQASVSGNATTPRRLGGLGAWMKTNVNFQTGGSPSSGANPTGDSNGNADGTDARTDNSAVTDFSQDKFDLVMQSIWESGGNPDRVYLSAFQMDKALGFTGNNSQRSTVQAGDEKVVKSLAVYVTPWGTVEFVPSRENRSRDVYILQNDMFATPVLRPTKSIELAKTGDATTRQVTTELTLCVKNEKSSGLIADNSTS